MHAKSWTWMVVALAVAAVPRPGRGETRLEARGAAPAGEGLEADPSPDPAPPMAKPEDRALWTQGNEVTSAIQVERGRASRLQLVLLNLRYADRLRALAARGGEDVERADPAARRLLAAHGAQLVTLTARWPVDTYRGCGYPALEFGSLAAFDRAAAPDLDLHRSLLRTCVDAAGKAVATLREANDDLEAAMRQADAVLVAAGLGAPSAGATQEAAREGRLSADADGHDRRDRDHAHDHDRDHDHDHDRGSRGHHGRVERLDDEGR
jgi:hypothetical protein